MDKQQGPLSLNSTVVSDSLRTHGLYSPWHSPGQNTGVGKLFSSPGHLPNPGIELRSPALQADSLPAEPQGKPNNAVKAITDQHEVLL